MKPANVGSSMREMSLKLSCSFRFTYLVECDILRNVIMNTYLLLFLTYFRFGTKHGWLRICCSVQINNLFSYEIKYNILGVGIQSCSQGNCTVLAVLFTMPNFIIANSKSVILSVGEQAPILSRASYGH